ETSFLTPKTDSLTEVPFDRLCPPRKETPERPNRGRLSKLPEKAEPQWRPAVMTNHECRRKFYVLPLFAVLIAALLLSACTTPEKAKAQHVARGQALLKDKKFQEASIEFRAAIQIDDKLADAHWGLANSYEGLQRYQEAFEEMKQVVELDKNNLDVRVRLGNYYLMGGKQSPAAVSEAERLAKEVLQKDGNHIEGHILM